MKKRPEFVPSFPWSFYVRWLNARYPRRMFMRRGWLGS